MPGELLDPAVVENLSYALLGAEALNLKNLYVEVFNTRKKHEEIAERAPGSLTEEDERFLRNAEDTVEEFRSKGKVEQVARMLVDGGSWGEAWGHILACDYKNVYGTENMQFGVYDSDRGPDLDYNTVNE